MSLSVFPQPCVFHCDAPIPVFHLTRYLNLHSQPDCALAQRALLRFLEQAFSMEPMGSGFEHIHLSVQPDAASPEGYRLTVSENEIHVVGADEAGVFYGVQTLKQLLLQTEGNLPALEITDAPRLRYRGLMLDCARCFIPKADLLRLLDAMALHKLNRLHWHLTDDQGWRLELFQNLLLAQIGGARVLAAGTKIETSAYYSKADVAKILAFAAERCITVIPEIDAPGHVGAALAAYPELSCTETPRNVTKRAGVRKDVLCLGKEATFARMKSIFDEVEALFPDSPIHIGGNDVPFDRWRACPHCQEKMRSAGFNDAAQLYADYIDRAARYLKEKGHTVIRWSDPADRFVQADTILQVCGRAELSCARVIDSDAAFRLDLPKGVLSLRDIYTHTPAVGNAAPYGAEACLWTDALPDADHVYGFLFPRLAAFCETAWTRPEAKDYARFLTSLPVCHAVLLTVGIDCDVAAHDRLRAIDRFDLIKYRLRRRKDTV